jgi:hypothetical protein
LNNFAFLVEAWDARRGLQKGFRIWVITQDSYSTSSIAVVQHREALHSADCLDFALLQCKILLRVTPDEARQLAQRRPCNSQASLWQRI